MGLTCKLCPKACQLEKNERGDCRARANVDGKLLTLVYGRPCALHIDPIEKKPLYHFYPGSPILSLATAGCNLHCKNCQNWQISQANPEDVSSYRLSPQRIVDICRQETCSLIAYTYTEPLTFYEYTYDTASLAASSVKGEFFPPAKNQFTVPGTTTMRSNTARKVWKRLEP